MSDIKPIEFDEPFDRAYIPVNSRYEVQTKGKGSSFRIANTMTHERWLIADERLHPMLTELAYGVHAELSQAIAEITRLTEIIAENEADAKRYRFIRAGFTRSNKLVVAIDSDIPRGIKRYLDVHLDENVDEAMRVKGEL